MWDLLIWRLLGGVDIKGKARCLVLNILFWGRSLSLIGEKLNRPLTGKSCVQDKCHFAQGEYWWHEESMTLFCVGIPLGTSSVFFKIRYHPMVIPAIRVKASFFFGIWSEELSVCLSSVPIYSSIDLSCLSNHLPIVLSYLFIYVSVYALIHLPIYSSIHPLIYLSFLSICLSNCLSGLPRWLSCKESTCQSRRLRFDPWLVKISWKSKLWPTPVFLPVECHGQRSLVGYSPRGHKRFRHDLWT